MDFPEAAQRIADNHGFKSWRILIERLVGTASVIELNEAITEAAELYMRHAVNEAVRKDRDDREGYYGEYMNQRLIIGWDELNLRPLPFPEEAL